MNRYFWLLMRFIGDEHTPAERRAVYDRARRALLAQLGATEGTEFRASYERLAFEEAVRTIEAGVARWGQHGSNAPASQGS